MTSRSRIFAVLLVSFLSMALLSGCGGSVAGTYDMDKVAVKAAAEAEIKKQQEKDPNNPMAAMGSGMVMGMIDAMTFTLTLNEDGTASMVISGMGPAETTTGNYKVDGSNITLTMTEKGGSPESITGTVSGDTIRLKPPKADDMPFDLVFKKRS
jgi:hypothetical protein